MSDELAGLVAGQIATRAPGRLKPRALLIPMRLGADECQNTPGRSSSTHTPKTDAFRHRRPTRSLPTAFMFPLSVFWVAYNRSVRPLGGECDHQRRKSKTLFTSPSNPTAVEQWTVPRRSGFVEGTAPWH